MKSPLVSTNAGSSPISKQPLALFERHRLIAGAEHGARARRCGRGSGGGFMGPCLYPASLIALYRACHDARRHGGETPYSVADDAISRNVAELVAAPLGGWRAIKPKRRHDASGIEQALLSSWREALSEACAEQARYRNKQAFAWRPRAIAAIAKIAFDSPVNQRVSQMRGMARRL